MTIPIKTYNQFLGDMVRKILANSTLDDINKGSVLLTILEACATNDFENNAAILSVLDLLNIDSLRNSDLDARAADYGLVKKNAQKASGYISVSDSSMTKLSSGLYQVKSAPIAGQTVLYVNDAEGWDASSEAIDIFIGRGTPNFEGPLRTTAIDSLGSYWRITLASALERNHLISETVIHGQNTSDRFISAGTTCIIPANNINPEVRYTVLRDTVLAAGEDIVHNVPIVAENGGILSNAGIGTITQFRSVPFASAVCTNPTALTNGTNVETNEELRERIKAYSSTLARGTKAAILNAVNNITDIDGGNQVTSSKITEAVAVGNPALLYVDDGTGLQPTYAGQNIDILLARATGYEEFLQLANFPVPRPFVTNNILGPYALADGMTFNVKVDDIEESIVFSAADFNNIASASLAEVINAINSQATLYRVRFTDASNYLLIYPVAHDVETLQISPIGVLDDIDLYANAALGFPTSEVSYIYLYQNNVLLNEKASAATLYTNTFSNWNILSSGNIVISVDNTPSQDYTFTTSDFGGKSFAALTINDWVTALNRSFAGITATATPTSKIKIVSNKVGDESKLEIISGSLQDNWFTDASTISTGVNADFQLNRQTGMIRMLTTITAGDSITAGTGDTKGNYISATSTTGVYNISSDSDSRTAVIAISTDANESAYKSIVMPIDSSIVVTGTTTVRLRSSSSIDMFKYIQPDDYIYISYHDKGNWFALADCGIKKVIAKGSHIDTDNAWIEYKQATTVTTGTFTVLASEDIQAFSSTSYPQLWKSSFVIGAPATAYVQSLQTSFTDKMTNINPTIYRTNMLKISSTTEYNGNITIPVSVANAALIYPTGGDTQTGDAPHIANKVTEKDTFSFFKRSTPNYSNKPIWLDRCTYGDLCSTITTPVAPQADTATYSEEITSTIFDDAIAELSDLIFFTKGNNQNQYRSIQTYVATANTLRTQQATPYTILHHVTSDKVELAKPLQIHPNDNIVVVMDQDTVAKTIDIPLSRTGIINDTVVPSNIDFSANDLGSEANTEFSSAVVWGTTANHTDFKDYAVWMQARNWYISGGAPTADATYSIIPRSTLYGSQGENIKFRLDYPARADANAKVVHSNIGTNSVVTCTYGSGSARNLNLSINDEVSIAKWPGTYPYAAVVDVHPEYSRGVARYTFPDTVSFGSVVVGDCISISSTCGFSNADNTGVFKVLGVSNTAGAKYVDVYNPHIVPTGIGNPERTSITLVADTSVKERSQIKCGADTVEHPLTGYSFYLYNGETGNDRIVFWYSLNGTGTEPIVSGADDYVPIPYTLEDSAITIANKTATVIDSDPRFDIVGSIPTDTDTFMIDCSTVGARTAVDMDFLTAYNSDFVASSLIQGDNGPINNQYVILYDNIGPICYWFNVESSGAEPNITGVTRYIEVTDINQLDTATDIINCLEVAIGTDFVTSKNLGTIEITCNDNGVRTDASMSAILLAADASIEVLQKGTADENEIIVTPSLVQVFPLSETTVAEVVTAVNAGSLIKLSVVGDDSSIINLATKDEMVASGTGYTRSISYGHNPDPGYAHVYSVVCAAATSLDGKFISFTSNVGTTVAFWYDITGGAAPSTSATRTVAITTVLATDDKYEVALKTAKAIDADPEFRCAGVDGYTQDTIYPTLIATYYGMANYGNESDTGFDIHNFEYGTDGVYGENEYISLYDGINWIKTFTNTDPTFTLKAEMLLPGSVDTSVYSLSANPNYEDETLLGEQFKLVPVTSDNVQHHLTQKALSQLPIVANVDQINMKRQLQIKSQQLGSSGAVNITGGSGNSAAFSIFGESKHIIDGDNTYLSVQIPAYPETLTKGSIVKLSNGNNVKRLSRLNALDVIDIDEDAGNVYYQYGYKDIDATTSTEIAIVDVSANGYKTQTLTIATATVNGTYWIIKSANNERSYCIWYSVNGGTTTVPSVIADHYIEVDYTSGNNATIVATKTLTAILADYYFIQDFSATRNTAALTIVNNTYGDAKDILVSSSYLTTTVTVEGSNYNREAGTVWRWRSYTNKLNYTNVVAGDLLQPYELSGWSSGNMSLDTGDNSISGFPIISVNSDNNYVDIVNPYGVAMSQTAIGSGHINVTSTPIVKWNIPHISKVQLSSVIFDNSGTTFTAISTTPHRLKETDTINFYDISTTMTIPSGTVFTVDTITNSMEFSGTITVQHPSDGTYIQGSFINASKTNTKYKVELLGYSNFVKVSYVSGEHPHFLDFGVAIDDIVILSGSTFHSSNRGTFRVLGIDNDYFIIQNENAVQERNTIDYFNNLEISANWTAFSTDVTGIAGTFTNVSVGDWVKKVSDSHDLYVQVLQMEDSTGTSTTAALATKIVLAEQYRGTTGSVEGVGFNSSTDIDTGVILRSLDDIVFYEGDSVMIGDKLSIASNATGTWFNDANAGVFNIIGIGTTTSSGIFNGSNKPYICVSNANGVDEDGVILGTNVASFAILEGINNRFSSIREVHHLAIDSIDASRRVVYLTPSGRTYKWTYANGTSMELLGKIGFNTDLNIGIDGYTYYTGLLQTVQKTIDGFEPDPLEYPGMRAVGGVIEVLPSLIQNISLAIDITTNEGTNLNEISTGIQSAVIDYVNNLGVGEDVILAEVVVACMGVTGVEAATLVNPAPSTERIAIADDETAYIEPANINIS